MEGDKDAKKLRTLMNAYGLNQMIQEPTHRNGHTLDHIYVNDSQTEFKHSVQGGTFGITTDHYPCIIELPCKKQEEERERIVTRQLGKIDQVKFKEDIQKMVSRLQGSEEDFEAMYKKYKSSAENILNEYAPEVSKNVSKKKQPEWIDQEYKIARAKRRKLEKIWKRSRTEENHQTYVDQRNLCARMSKEKQESYYSKLIDSASNKQKQLFQVVEKMLDKRDERVLPTYTDPVQLANEFNHYYVDKIENLRKSIPQTKEPMIIQPKSFDGEKLNHFAPTTVEEVKRIIKESGMKTSSEDPLPQGAFRMVEQELIPLLVELVNKSLEEGSMVPVRSSVIDPLLKKMGLDIEGRKNYRPVNNLVSLSKLIERIVKSRIEEHMEKNRLHNKRAFGYKTHHSTETMMVGLVNDILTGFDENKCTVMVFLDLSAAFDTIDINKLLTILDDEIGLGGTALKWCESFLTQRTQRVKINGHYSEELEVKYGSVQGSVLGPKFFNVYVRSQPEVFLKCGFETSSFADDSNGSKTFSITFQFNVLQNDVAHCVNNVINWMNYQCLKINPDKTEIILFHPKSVQHQIIVGGTFIGKDCIRFSREVKNVGVWLDSQLNLNKQVNKVVSQCYMHVKNIGRIRNVLSKQQTEMLVHAVITGTMDYCNSLLINISKSNLYKLQKLQNAAARLVVRCSRRTSMSEVLRSLNWLRVESRIIFKILLLVHKCVNGQCSENLKIKYKTHNCRPEEYLMLEVKHVKTNYGRRTFDYVGPRLWNALPLDIRTEEKVENFKKKVKTMLFNGTEELKARAWKYT